MIKRNKCFYVIIGYFFKIFLNFRRFRERNKLVREKQLREAAEREKAAMEQRLLQYQEEIRLANEALVSYVHFVIRFILLMINRHKSPFSCIF